MGALCPAKEEGAVEKPGPPPAANTQKEPVGGFNGNAIKEMHPANIGKQVWSSGTGSAPSNKGPPKSIGSGSSMMTSEDFVWKRYIGNGSYGKVALVAKKDSKKIYAMKILKKSDLNVNSTLDNILTEKNVLMRTESPFIVKLRYSFQDQTCLYFCIDYVPGGELFKYLKKSGKFTFDQTKFYAAEVLLGLEHLHSKLGVIYRDLKPENILVDANGHIKLTDFGLSKEGLKKTNSFCGTPEYLAPEVIEHKGHTHLVDYWTFGCLIYEMLSGHPPFQSKVPEELYRLICAGNFKISSKLDERAKDLIKKLLVINPQQRLGVNGVEEIKNHAFFGGLNWDDVKALKTKAPFLPEVRQEETSEFLYRPTPQQNAGQHVDGFTFVENRQTPNK